MSKIIQSSVFAVLLGVCTECLSAENWKVVMEEGATRVSAECSSVKQAARCAAELFRQEAQRSEDGWNPSVTIYFNDHPVEFQDEVTVCIVCNNCPMCPNGPNGEVCATAEGEPQALIQAILDCASYGGTPGLEVEEGEIDPPMEGEPCPNPCHYGCIANTSTTACSPCPEVCCSSAPARVGPIRRLFGRLCRR